MPLRVVETEDNDRWFVAANGNVASPASGRAALQTVGQTQQLIDEVQILEANEFQQLLFEGARSETTAGDGKGKKDAVLQQKRDEKFQRAGTLSIFECDTTSPIDMCFTLAPFYSPRCPTMWRCSAKSKNRSRLGLILSLLFEQC